MKWPFSKKEQPPVKSLSMREALEEPRADLAVAEWLTQAMQREGAQAKEVLMAYQVDRFLQEVNSGGVMGFFAWEFENVPATIDALRTVGLEDIAVDLQEAMNVLAGSKWFATQEEFEEARGNQDQSDQLDALSDKIIAASARIESSNHQFIRTHIAAFQ